MAEITALNGSPLRSEKKVTLTLTFDKSTGKLDIGGEFDNYDVGLNILAQATRWMECQYQMAQQMAFTAQAERDRALLAGLKH